MFQNDKFEKKWELVNRTFEKFKGANILPVAVTVGNAKMTITEEVLQKQFNSLHDEIFTIALNP